MIYGESDYWIAHYRSMSEGSAERRAYSAQARRRSLAARTAAFAKALFGSIARRGVKSKAGLDGRA